MFLDGDPITPHLPLVAGILKRALGRRDLPEKLPQFEPGPLLGRQEGHARLFRVVSHEHRHEQGQDEHGTEQVEHDEKEPVLRGDVILGLLALAGNAHGAGLHVGPTLLTDNLEQNEERVPEVVEIVVRISSRSRGKDLPIVWLTDVLIHAVVQITLKVAIVALHQ